MKLVLHEGAASSALQALKLALSRDHVLKGHAT